MISFTPEQQEAIGCRDGSLAVAANAGSGKTAVLVERFVRAVVDDGCDLARILALTFTERAAGELRARVRRRFIELGRRDAARDTETAFISTFHGFCARVLRTHPLAAGVGSDFAVLDERDALDLREQAYARILPDWSRREGALDLLAAGGVDALRRELIAVYLERRSRGEELPSLPPALVRHDSDESLAALARARIEIVRELEAAGDGVRVCDALARLRAEEAPRLGRGAAALRTPAADAYELARVQLEQARTDTAALPVAALLADGLERFGADYAELKAERGALDFDDLELRAAALLSGVPRIGDAWSERFDMLMVDELQDTNPRQMALLKRLDRDNLFSVGDAFQSIYGFRHADVSLFTARRAELAARGRARELPHNHRAQPALVAAINRAFAPCFGESFVALVAGRPETAGGEPLVELLLTDTRGWPSQAGAGAAWRHAEAALLGRRIAELCASGTAPDDVVVLMRYGTEMWAFERALADVGVPALATGAGSFFERPEIVDMTAYALALANPLEDRALATVLRSPLVEVSGDCLAVLALAGRGSLWEATAVARELALPASEQAALERFRSWFSGERTAAATLGADELLRRVIAERYEERVLRLPGGEGRFANLLKLRRLAREHERRAGRDLRRFADALAAGRLGGPGETDAPAPAAGATRLMTVHAAKGLEFPVVCVADLGHGPPTTRPALLAGTGELGVCFRTFDRERVEAFAWRRLREQRELAAAAEERRISYVALTRARERLIVSGAADLARWPREGRSSPQIAWLGPALVPALPELLESGATEHVGDGVRLVVQRAHAPAGRVGGTGEQLELLEPELPAAASAAPAPVRAPSAQLSYSALSEHARCGYRYYLQRVVGLADVAPPPGLAPAPGLAAAARGSLVHALLEELDFAQPRLPEAVAGVSPQDGAEILALVSAFARSALCERLARAGTVRREHGFALGLNDDGTLLTGVIDVLADEGSGAMLVVDYKTDRIEEPPATVVERDYELQRLAYALAALRGGAATVEVVHLFLRRPEEPVAARFARSDQESVAGRLRAAAQPLLEQRFQVAADPGPALCATCPGRARLCSWDEAATLRGLV